MAIIWNYPPNVSTSCDANFHRLLQKLKFPIIVLALVLFVGNIVSTSGYKNPTVPAEENKTGDDRLVQLCSDCRLTSESIDELIRKPRQMDSYGQMSDRIDLDKIKKTICREIVSDHDRERCRSFYFSYQPTILKWKQATTEKTASNYSGRPALVSFFDFVCIREHKFCCPSQSYGPKCMKCPKCAPNEFCHGEGTRIGNGTCICKEGHTGLQCNTCLPGYYFDKEALKFPEDSSKRIVCKKCHRSCQYCRLGGPKGCEVCQEGFSWQPGYGCLDVDECVKSGNKICGPKTFCVNTEGSYFCYECDRACDGCQGDGPDMCLRCANGYKLDSTGNCVAERKTILPPEANYYRYAIYAGLCVCTCIILNNNVYLASFVGLGVALYISASEYVMSGHPGEDSGNSNAAAGLSAAHPGLGLSHLGL